MDTTLFVQLPDGTFAAVSRTVDWGQIIIILILVALLTLYIYDLWTRKHT